MIAPPALACSRHRSDCATSCGRRVASMLLRMQCGAAAVLKRHPHSLAPNKHPAPPDEGCAAAASRRPPVCNTAPRHFWEHSCPLQHHSAF